MRVTCDHSGDRTQMCITCMNYEADRQELLKEIEKLKETNECQLWNLAGCNTFALGYGLDESYDQSMALPVLRDVHKMAVKNKELLVDRQELLKEVERLKTENSRLIILEPHYYRDAEILDRSRKANQELLSGIKGVLGVLEHHSQCCTDFGGTGEDAQEALTTLNKLVEKYK